VQAQEAPASSKDDLPDLDRPQGRTATFSAGPNGARLENTFGRQKLVVTPEYSNQTGLSIGGALASMLGDNAAVGVLLTVGADKKEWLINAGYKIDERQRFIVTAGQLEQFLDYAFRSGTDKVGMTQNSGALSYQLQLGNEFLRFLEVNGYVAKTASRDLADKTFAIDTATLFELWNDPRRIAGGKVTGLQGKLGFSPSQNSVVKVSFGQERLSYDLLTGTDSVNRLTGGVEWAQQLGSGYQLRAGADTFASQNRYTIGIDRSLAGSGGRHNLGVSLIGLRGRDGLGDDNQFKLSYTYVFGTSAGSGRGTALGMSPRANAAPDQTTPWSGSALLDQVAQRPSFIPSHVIAKIDNTALPTRLIAIDKTALPAGSTISAATGDITTPLGVVVTTIAGVTKNLGAFANTGQFSLSGNSLVIKPSLIVQPAVGVTDSYVVTVNNFGGGTTLITILVSHGSVKIDSIVVSAGGADVTPPTTTAAPAISVAAADTTASVTQTINETGTGYYLVLAAAAAAPTVAAVKAGTSFAMTAATPAVVSLTGLTASTAYKYYFVAKDTANNDQAAVSAGLAITTTADITPPATPATLTLTGNVGALAGFTNTAAVSLAVAAVTDPSGVSWFVSESSSAPAVGDGGWSSTQPTSFTLSAGDGAKSVYVYVKDNVGNAQATGKSAAIALDTTAPSYASENLLNLDTMNGTGSGTISFNEAVASVTSISFKKFSDNSAAGGTISVTGGLTTTTLTVNWTAPSAIIMVLIELVIEDAAGNSRTVNTNSYWLFP
jgi:hypothetical protein